MVPSEGAGKITPQENTKKIVGTGEVVGLLALKIINELYNSVQ